MLVKYDVRHTPVFYALLPFLELEFNIILYCSLMIYTHGYEPAHGIFQVLEELPWMEQIQASVFRQILGLEVKTECKHSQGGVRCTAC